MIGIPIPIEDQIFLVHPLKGVPRHIGKTIFREEGADAAGLDTKLDRCAIPKTYRSGEPEFRKVAGPKLRIPLLAKKITAFPEGDIRPPSGQVEPGLQFVPSTTSGFRRGLR